MSQRRDSRANAERIVEALRKLWMDEGSPSLEQVARAAGVGIATLYRHFPSRCDLEREAFLQIFGDEIAPICDRADSEEDVDLLTIAEEIVAAVSRYAPVLRAIELSQVTDEALKALAEPFMDLVRAGQEAEVLRPDLEEADLYWVLRMAVLGLSSPISSTTVRRRYLALIMPSLAPDGPALPPLSEEDYERLSIPPEHREPAGTSRRGA